MNLAVIVIVTLVFFGIIGGAGFAVYVQLQKTDPKKADTSVNPDIDTAQDFLPFEDIRDGMINLGNHRYRAIIECSSTNYNLKTDKEKEIIELSFQRFINSLTFPITFFVQTKVIDNSKMLEGLKQELEATVKKYPQMEEYANIYINEMMNLSAHIGNNKQKKKYIIIPYEDAINLGKLSDREKYEYSSKELYNRANLIIDGLSAVGVKAKVLDTKELAELVYSVYHKDNYSNVENIVNGEFLTLVVEGERNRAEDITDDAKIDWILYEAQMRIKNELLSKNLPDFLQKEYEMTIAELDKLRDENGGYFKNVNGNSEVSLAKTSKGGYR